MQFSKIFIEIDKKALIYFTEHFGKTMRKYRRNFKLILPSCEEILKDKKFSDMGKISNKFWKYFCARH